MSGPSGMLSVRTPHQYPGSSDPEGRSTIAVDAMIQPTTARAMATMPPPPPPVNTDDR